MDEIELQRAADQLVHREVQCCLSSLVSTLASGLGRIVDVNRARNDPAAALDDLTEQAAQLASSVDDYEEAARQEGWTGPHKDQFGATFFRDESDGQTWACAGWQELCEAHDIEPYQWEVYEHWAVSTWLAEKLHTQGERVDTDFAGLCVWARTTTGQAISMDGVIRRIVAELHKAPA